MHHGSVCLLIGGIGLRILVPGIKFRGRIGRIRPKERGNIELDGSMVLFGAL